MTIDRNSPSPAQSGWSAVVANGLLAGMLLFGLILLLGAINMIKDGAPPWAIAAVVVTALFVGGFGAHRFYALHFRERVMAAREATVAARYPDQPWMLNPDWAKGRIVDYRIGKVILPWLFCIGWCGGIIAVLKLRADAVMTAFSSPAQWGTWVFAGFFVLITLMALGAAVRQTRAWLRLGDGVLLLDTVPGLLGGSFKARLQTRLRQVPKSPLRIELSCTRLGRRRDGRAGTTEQQLWTQSQEVKATKAMQSASGVIVPIAFDLPADLPESGGEAAATDIVWTLRVVSKARKGTGFSYSWAAPVFRQRG